MAKTEGTKQLDVYEDLRREWVSLEDMLCVISCGRLSDNQILTPFVHIIYGIA